MNKLIDFYFKRCILMSGTVSKTLEFSAMQDEARVKIEFDRVGK